MSFPAYQFARNILPLYVPTSFRVDGYNTDKRPPHSKSNLIVAGTPLVLHASGLPTPAFMSTIGDYDFVTYLNGTGTGAQELFGLSAEKFTPNPVDPENNWKEPFIQSDIGLVMLTPGVFIEGSLYYDGEGGVEETVAHADVGSVVSIKAVGSGLSEIFVVDKETDTQGAAFPFQIVKLLDEVGTVRGRVLVQPAFTFFTIPLMNLFVPEQPQN